jgi:hypothetical protein
MNCIEMSCIEIKKCKRCNFTSLVANPPRDPAGGAALSNSSQIQSEARPIFKSNNQIFIPPDLLRTSLRKTCGNLLVRTLSQPKTRNGKKTQSLQKMSDAKDAPSLLVIPYSIPFTQTSPDVTMEKIKARLIKDQAQVSVEKGDVVEHDELRESKWIVALIAPLRNNMGHRQSLLRAPFATVSKRIGETHIQKHSISITSARKLVLDEACNVRPHIKSRLEKIAEPDVTFNLTKKLNDVQIQMQGMGEAVERARIKTLVMLDQMMGYPSESLEMDRTKQPCIAGKKRVRCLQIMKETGAIVYFPPHTLSLGRTQEDMTFRKIVWITGTPASIARAKERLLSLEVLLTLVFWVV